MQEEREKQVNWEKEAEAVINDIRDHVSHVAIAKSPNSDPSRIYFDLETLEGDKFIIAMDSRGFTISNVNQNDKSSHVYETINALLDNKSSKYRAAFASSLVSKMNSLLHGHGSL